MEKTGWRRSPCSPPPTSASPSPLSISSLRRGAALVPTCATEIVALFPTLYSATSGGLSQGLPPDHEPALFTQSQPTTPVANSAKARDIPAGSRESRGRAPSPGPAAPLTAPSSGSQTPARDVHIVGTCPNLHANKRVPSLNSLLQCNPARCFRHQVACTPGASYREQTWAQQ